MVSQTKLQDEKLQLSGKEILDCMIQGSRLFARSSEGKRIKRLIEHAEGGTERQYQRVMYRMMKRAVWIRLANDAVLAKARPIIEKQQQAKDTEYYAEMMNNAVDRVREEAKRQEREKITPDVEEVIRVLAKVVPHDQNDMISWAVKSQDSVYTNAGAAYRLLLALKQVLEKEDEQ